MVSSHVPKKHPKKQLKGIPKENFLFVLVEDKSTYQPNIKTWRDVWFLLPVEVRINHIPTGISYYIILGKSLVF
jgi:hypothetical protein